MLRCVAMVMLSQRTPAGSLCLCACMIERGRWTNGQESKQTEPGSNSLIYPPPPPPQSCSCSSSLFTILCPLPSGRPSSQTQCSWAQLSMFPHTDHPLSGPLYLFGWVVDLPLAPARGSPFLLASVLNQTVCSLKWPITDTQIGDYKAAACFQSVRQHEHDH